MRKLIFLSLGFLLFTNSGWGQDIYELNSILEIRLTFAEEEWDGYLDSIKQRGYDERLIGDAVINGKAYPRTGVRYKGNSSYYNVRKSGSSKLPFNLKVDFENKDQELPGGFTTLKLSNVFRDPSFLREVLAYEIAGKYMPAPRANYAKVYVNEKYLGLYNCTESVDDLFLKKFFGEKKGALIKCDPNWNERTTPGCPEGDKASLMYLGEDSICYFNLYELKDNASWKDVIDLTRALKNKPGQMENILDIDQTLWMLAYNNVLVNLDSYTGRLCHNYYLYKDTTGVYHPVLWDMNLSFGGFRYTGIGAPLSNEKMQTMSPFIHYSEKNPKRPLITNLLNIDLYRKIYVAHMQTIVNDFFVDGTFLKRAEEIQNDIAELVKNDENRLYEFEDFRKNLTETVKIDKSMIIGLAELMDARAAYLTNHPLFKKEAPLIEKVKHKASNEEVTITASISGTQKTWLYHRKETYGNFQRIEMYDDGTHGDQVADDGIWSTSIAIGEGLQYYLVAEGEKTAALSPERASYEFYEIQSN